MFPRSFSLVLFSMFSPLAGMLCASVTPAADTAYPSGAKLFTANPESYTPAQRDVTGTRKLRQTFQLSQTITVNGIVLSLIANGATGGLVLNVYEVADVNASTWSPGTLVKTITVSAGSVLPVSTARLGLTLTDSDVFTLPRRNNGTQGYGIEISNADGSTMIGTVRHTNDGVDRYTAGVYYTETGAISSVTRDFGVAFSSVPGTAAADVKSLLGRGTGIYLDGGADENTDGSVVSIWSSAADDWNGSTGGFGEDVSDSAITVGADVLDANSTDTDQGLVTVAVTGLEANRQYDVWAVHVGVQGTGASNGFYWGTSPASLSLFTQTANPGTLIANNGGSNPQLVGVMVGRITTSGSGETTFYFDDINSGTASGRSEIDGVLLEPTIAGETRIAESSALRLELDTSPFTFRVIDKSSGTTLVSQSGNAFTVAGSALGVSYAQNVVVDATGMSADLVLAGSAVLARVLFDFSTPETLQVTLSATGAQRIAQSFVDNGENLYGVWSYPFADGIDCRGTDQDFLGISTTYNSRINYCSARAPFYLTNRGYGIYALSEARGRFTMAVNGVTGFSFYEPSLTYYVIRGETPAKILARYNALAGGSLMPPDWALGSIWWKDDDHVSFPSGVTNAQGSVIDTANQLRSRQIPATAIWIDRPYGTGTNGWGNFDFDSSFPNPSQMVADLQARGMNLMLWITNRAFTGTTLATTAAAGDYLFPTVSPVGGGGSALDVRIPDAATLFKNHLNAFVSLGVKGYKIDRGDELEFAPADENETVTAFHKATYEGLEAGHPADHFSFARDVVDTGRKYVGVWNGDPAGTHLGLRTSLMSGLRAGLMNFPLWGSDIGGYNGKPSEDAFARWFQVGAYSPIMEVLIGNGRTPWINYSSNLVAIARTQTAAHHDLIPYTRSLIYHATQSGMPAMRAMFLEYPDDSAVTTMWDQYFYGPNVLVAPVLYSGATSRNVYLPAGSWLDYNTRSSLLAGSSSPLVSAPIATIPLFVREGAIIPRGDVLRANNNWTANWTARLRVECFPSDSASSSFDYYTGSVVRPITCSNVGHTLTIQFDDLGLPGDLEIYLDSAGAVTRNGLPLVAGSDYIYDAAARLMRVPFSGATTLVVAQAYGAFSPINLWKTARFGTLANPTQSGDLADPDGDGMNNLTEFALGLDPLVAEAPVPPRVVTTKDGDSGEYLTLVYRRGKNVSGAVFTVETSTDLQTWNSGASWTQTVGVVDLGSQEEVTEKVLAPLASQSRQFVRLRISRP